MYQTCYGEDISIAHRGHRDHHPVEGGRDGGEARVLINLDEVAKTRKDEATDAHEEDKKEQFLVTVL